MDIKKISWKHLLLAIFIFVGYTVCEVLIERTVANNVYVLRVITNFVLVMSWRRLVKPIYSKIMNKGLGKAEESATTEVPVENNEERTGEAA